MASVVIVGHEPTSWNSNPPGFTIGNAITPVEDEALLGLRVNIGQPALSPGIAFSVRVRVYDAFTGLAIRSGIATGAFVQNQYVDILFSSNVFLEAGKKYLITAYSAACTFGANLSAGGSHTHNSPTSTFNHVIVWNNEKRTGEGDSFPGSVSTGIEIVLRPIVDHPNTGPLVPALLSREGLSTDATPMFRCFVTDPDTDDKVRARFQVYDSLGALVGAIESTLGDNLRFVTVEYPASLPRGVYTVRARAIDAGGITSSLGNPLEFLVTSQVNINKEIKWDIKGQVSLSFETKWDIAEENTISFETAWNVAVFFELDFETTWAQNTPWETVAFDSPTTTWDEVEL